jgi:hypothetical protein
MHLIGKMSLAVAVVRVRFWEAVFVPSWSPVKRRPEAVISNIFSVSRVGDSIVSSRFHNVDFSARWPFSVAQTLGGDASDKERIRIT